MVLTPDQALASMNHAHISAGAMALPRPAHKGDSHDGTR